MSSTAEDLRNQGPAGDFTRGIRHFAEAINGIDLHGSEAVIREGEPGIAEINEQVAWQTLLAADALRYLTLQTCGSKESGHPGGYASSAEAHAALMMLGHTNIITEVGHHAPGFYSAMFLDGSLEDMGIYTVDDMMLRFREKDGLLGHLSGAIPGLLAPAGPLGQGQHFAMAGAYLHRDKLFPVTIGDGGLGEPYILSAMMHFNTAFPSITNFLPVLIWNGYSQEHHAMVSLKSNEEMTAYWQGHGFKKIVIVDAKAFDDAGQAGDYVDSTLFSMPQRLAFTRAVLEGMQDAAGSALTGTLTVFIIKQLKGAGVHRHGAKSHNLYPGDSLEAESIVSALKKRALPKQAWELVRQNLRRAGGGPASRTVVTESELDITILSDLPVNEFAVGEKAIPSTAMGALVAAVGQQDSRFLVTNADGNEASGMKNISQALKIVHPTEDELYCQGPDGQVYEPLSEDACAGLAAGLALFGSRAMWLSYESFVINGLPIVQTVSQAMAELRRKTPSIMMMFTAGALEQGRNGWTHQRPEIENYLAAMMRNGNSYTLFPADANMIQAAYEWGINTFNKSIAIIASKSALPVYTDMRQARQAIEQGATTLYATEGNTDGKTVVLAATGDMVFLPVFEAKAQLEAQGYRVKIVSIANPRRLYRSSDVAWQTVSQPDGQFMSDERFESMFGGDILLGITGGASGALEPVMLRSRAQCRDVMAWRRGETTASPAQIMDFNNLGSKDIIQRVENLSA